MSAELSLKGALNSPLLFQGVQHCFLWELPALLLRTALSGVVNINLEFRACVLDWKQSLSSTLLLNQYSPSMPITLCVKYRKNQFLRLHFYLVYEEIIPGTLSGQDEIIIRLIKRARFQSSVRMIKSLGHPEIMIYCAAKHFVVFHSSAAVKAAALFFQIRSLLPVFHDMNVC